MYFSKNYNNFSALLFIIFLVVMFDYIIFEGLQNKIEPIFIPIILFSELLFIIFFLRNNIYDFEMDENKIRIKYKFKKAIKNYTLKNITKVILCNSQRNSMHNINFYFNDNSKISIPTSEKEELKKIYNYCKINSITCNVVGLPTGRTPTDYNW